MNHKNKLPTHHLSTDSSKDHDFCFPSFQQIRGSQVFVSLKKHQPHHPIRNLPPQQNSFCPIKKQKSPPKNDRKTIETTIKQLLKGKQQLVNYLESEKQFIQVLDVHDHQLRYLSKNRGKLTSSLTQKKKSRIDTYTTAKNNPKPHLSKVSHPKNKPKKAQNQALTMEVLIKEAQSYLNYSRAIIQKRHYQTVSFTDAHSDENQKYTPDDCEQPKYQKQSHQQKLNQNFSISSKENYLPGQQCFVMTSPKRKHLKLNEKSNFQYNNFHTTKYGLTHFSPWAFSKNQYDTELGSNPSIIQTRRPIQDKVFREKVLNCAQKLTQNQGGAIKKKRQSGRKQNRKYPITDSQKQPLKETISEYGRGKENMEKRIINNGSQKRQNTFNEQVYLRLGIKKDQKDSLNEKSNVKVVRSSQVVILQSGTINSSDIFGSKEYAKQMFHPRKSLKGQSSQFQHKKIITNQEQIFQTEINTKKGQRQNSYPKQRQSNANGQIPANGLTKQSELGELKKTEQFLKQIILTKNSVSYANSRSISKKEFKQINQSIYEEKSAKRSNVFITKNLFQQKSHSPKFMKNKQSYSVSHQKEKLKTDEKIVENTCEKERKSNHETDISSVDKQNSKNGQSDYKKAKTSLDNPLSEKNMYELISNSNTKCLMEASVNGFYMINESKIRNKKNSFVRRKRHSMLVKKKNSTDNNTSQETGKRRFSYSTDKEMTNGNIYDLSILKQSKGFGIINPLTKQLYKKYVSIVQNRR